MEDASISLTSKIQTDSLCMEFARFICSTSYDDLPQAVVQAAKRGILDTLGVAMGALAEDTSRVILNYVQQSSREQSGSAAVFGQGYRSSPEMAALANGTLAHLLDFDDSHNPMGGHPSAPLVPTVLAVADQVGASGKEVLLAYAIGFEIETKFSRVVNPILYSRGWHPTSVLSTFATTAAAAKLMKLDETATANALATAASLCSGIKGNFGTLTKPLHVGKSAQSGIQAASLASFGHTANIGIFEAKMGFLDLFCSPNSADWKLETIQGKLGIPWELVDPGITVKPYPCCGSTHSTIDAHLLLREESKIDPSEICWIRNAIHERRIPHTDRPVLQRGLEGKFSNQYVTALSWIKGYISLDHFNDETLHEPEVLDLMSKVQFIADPEISKSSASETHAYVEVGLKDGRVLSCKVTKRKGSPSNKLTDKELEAKFSHCAERVHSPNWIKSVLNLIQGMELLEDINVLTDRLNDRVAK